MSRSNNPELEMRKRIQKIARLLSNDAIINWNKVAIACEELDDMFRLDGDKVRHDIPRYWYNNIGISAIYAWERCAEFAFEKGMTVKAAYAYRRLFDFTMDLGYLYRAVMSRLTLYRETNSYHDKDQFIYISEKFQLNLLRWLNYYSEAACQTECINELQNINLGVGELENFYLSFVNELQLVAEPESASVISTLLHEYMGQANIFIQSKIKYLAYATYVHQPYERSGSQFFVCAQPQNVPSTTLTEKVFNY